MSQETKPEIVINLSDIPAPTMEWLLERSENKPLIETIREILDAAVKASIVDHRFS